MSDGNWFDKPRNLAVSHLAGAVCSGFFLGLLAWASLGTEPVSQAEIKHMSVVPRRNLAFPDRLMFGPFFCEDDCSGHTSGWDWGRANHAKSTEDCSGRGSTSFLEGCVYYVQVRGYEDDEG